MRKSGVLLPVSSLPSKFGIGSFSKEAYEFVDFLADAGQAYWQILPLGPTGYGDSPYQSFSTFAGNPYFVDLQEFIDCGFLTSKECEKSEAGMNPQYVDYEKIYKTRFALLRKAYDKSKIDDNAEFAAFKCDNSNWLPDYTLFMALKDAFHGRSFLEWPQEIRLRRSKAMRAYAKELKDQCEFYAFIQYYFDKQWKALKEYANDKKVLIIGDIPIYVALDSADTWSHPELFQLDKKGYPTGVAGCPPDYFSKTGQLWGNPLYNWKFHSQTAYAWWISRLEQCFKLYDVVRIDHFRGFDEYYSIPYGNPTAEFGKWEKGPGIQLFNEMREVLGDKPVIAEDLGFLTQSVINLVCETGFPGMKILEFAFDSGEDNDYLPHNYEHNCVTYTGTHDNDTIIGWYKTLKPKDQKYVREYLHIHNAKNISWELIRLGSASVADTFIAPMQDYLQLGSEARVNTPSTLGDNWKWRMLPGVLSDGLAAKMNLVAKTYGRDC